MPNLSSCDSFSTHSPGEVISNIDYSIISGEDSWALEDYVKSVMCYRSRLMEMSFPDIREHLEMANLEGDCYAGRFKEFFLLKELRQRQMEIESKFKSGETVSSI